MTTEQLEKGNILLSKIDKIKSELEILNTPKPEYFKLYFAIDGLVVNVTNANEAKTFAAKVIESLREELAVLENELKEV